VWRLWRVAGNQGRGKYLQAPCDASYTPSVIPVPRNGMLRIGAPTATKKTAQTIPAVRRCLRVSRARCGQLADPNRPTWKSMPDKLPRCDYRIH
jgi:hypothetical protein